MKRVLEEVRGFTAKSGATVSGLAERVGEGAPGKCRGGGQRENRSLGKGGGLVCGLVRGEEGRGVFWRADLGDLPGPRAQALGWKAL